MQKSTAGKFHFEPPSRFTSLDHLVGAREQRRRHVEAERSTDRPTGLFSLRSAELSQRFFIQGPNLSQVPLGFFNGVPDGVQPLPDRNLASIIQRGLEALEAECGKNGEGISLLYSFAGGHVLSSSLAT
jgi:hypothetical protein